VGWSSLNGLRESTSAPNHDTGDAGRTKYDINGVHDLKLPAPTAGLSHNGVRSRDWAASRSRSPNPTTVEDNVLSWLTGRRRELAVPIRRGQGMRYDKGKN
jgi:hypothetical protein